MVFAEQPLALPGSGHYMQVQLDRYFITVTNICLYFLYCKKHVEPSCGEPGPTGQLSVTVSATVVSSRLLNVVSLHNQSLG